MIVGHQNLYRSVRDVRRIRCRIGGRGRHWWSSRPERQLGPEARAAAGSAVIAQLAPGDTVIVDTDRARRLIRDLAPLGSLFAVFRAFD